MKFIGEAKIYVQKPATAARRGAYPSAATSIIPAGGPDDGGGRGYGGAHPLRPPPTRNVMHTGSRLPLHPQIPRPARGRRGSDCYEREATASPCACRSVPEIVIGDPGSPPDAVSPASVPRQTVPRSAARPRSCRPRQGRWGSLGEYPFHSEQPNRSPRQCTAGRVRGEFAETGARDWRVHVAADVGLLSATSQARGKAPLIRAPVSAARPESRRLPLSLPLHLQSGRGSGSMPTRASSSPYLVSLGAPPTAPAWASASSNISAYPPAPASCGSGPMDPDADPVHDAVAIVGELAKHDPELAAKPRWLVLNKLDIIPADRTKSGIRTSSRLYKKALQVQRPHFPHHGDQRRRHQAPDLRDPGGPRTDGTASGCRERRFDAGGATA